MVREYGTRLWYEIMVRDYGTMHTFKSNMSTFNSNMTNFKSNTYNFISNIFSQKRDTKAESQSVLN